MNAGRTGADANALTSDHNSPLHLAASAGVLDCVLLLVKHGAKLSAKNKADTSFTKISLLDICLEDNPYLRSGTAYIIQDL